MPTEQPWGQQAHLYNALEDRRMLSRLGIRAGVGDGAFFVTTGGSGLQVQVRAGGALVQGSHAGATRQGLYPVHLPAHENLTLDAAHATLPRLDQIILRIRDTEPAPAVAGDGTSDGMVEKVTGTPTAGASRTNLVGLGTLPASSLLLAYVLVPAAFAGPLVDATHIREARQSLYRNTVIVTSLPTDPYDGQEHRYLADEANGIVWNLKYRAASTSAYKWEFIGGSSLFAYIQASCTKADSPYGDPSTGTAGPSITPPLAGEYMVTAAAARVAVAASDGQSGISTSGGGMAAPPTVGAGGRESIFRSGLNNNDQGSQQIETRETLTTAAVKMVYGTTSSANTGTWWSRGLRLTPIRVA